MQIGSVGGKRQKHLTIKNRKCKFAVTLVVGCSRSINKNGMRRCHWVSLRSPKPNPSAYLWGGSSHKPAYATTRKQKCDHYRRKPWNRRSHSFKICRPGRQHRVYLP